MDLSRRPRAVVVAQTPPAGLQASRGATVGFRTGLINPELYEVLAQTPDRGGDAIEQARDDGYWRILREAQPHAEPPLAGYIEQLLEHDEAGGARDDAPPRAPDSVKTHHRLCHL